MCRIGLKLGDGHRDKSSAGSVMACEMPPDAKTT
jgi:hypothetical protein